MCVCDNVYTVGSKKGREVGIQMVEVWHMVVRRLHTCSVVQANGKHIQHRLCCQVQGRGYDLNKYQHEVAMVFQELD